MAMQGRELPRKGRRVVWVAAPSPAPSPVRQAALTLRRGVVLLLAAVMLVALAMSMTVLSVTVWALTRSCVPFWVAR